MSHHLCIHGHFHQPTRDDPWLDRIVLQDSAYPHHDWTERVTAQCYAPNAFARILDDTGAIARIVNNYARISFDFAPTLLRWLEAHAPETYEAILAADAQSCDRFSGHGSALVTPYSHVVMPLATPRDKRTQLAWAVTDFERRFGRAPEGAWLPELAVDMDSLEALADFGLSFTLLAPAQALDVRPVSGGDWIEVSSERVDPRIPYVVSLPSGRSLSVFFLDDALSASIAFEQLLQDGSRFRDQLLTGFDGREGPALVHVATDGEVYGHHHRRGEMALAFALERIERDAVVQLTNYGEYLASFPPRVEVKIAEGTSWSCAHGLGRWVLEGDRQNAGRSPRSQRRRGPLRVAMDALHERTSVLFEDRAGRLFHDPWRARNRYVDLITDRTDQARTAFFAAEARKDLSYPDRVCALQLLEAQRHAILMFTSCGWLADDPSSLEATQVMNHAARAMQLMRKAIGVDLESDFLGRLRDAHRELPSNGDAAAIDAPHTLPTTLELDDVAAHYAIMSLLARRPVAHSTYCYDVWPRELRRHRGGNAAVFVGRATFLSRLTMESSDLAFAAMHFGHQHVNAGVRAVADEASWDDLLASFDAAAATGDTATILRSLDAWFEKLPLSISSLFPDERRTFLDEVLHGALAEDEAQLRQVYDRRAPLMRALSSMRAPLPPVLKAASEFVIHANLRKELSSPSTRADTVRAILEEAKRCEVALDPAELGLAWEKNALGCLDRLSGDTLDAERLADVANVVEVLAELPFEASLFRVQNLFHRAARTALLELLERAEEGDQGSRLHMQRYLEIGRKLGLSMCDLEQETGSATLAAAVKSCLREPPLPSATYRLQLGPSLGFAAVRDLADYFALLGVTHCYLSPIFRARSGSTHGYDVCHHGHVSEVLGGEDGFFALSEALRGRGLGILLDTVPNHMGIGDAANAWWMDVLENGASSPFAHFFDIEWAPVKPELADKVLIPILEDQYGRVLEAGKLNLTYEDGAFSIRHYQASLPIAPRTYVPILKHCLEAVGLGRAHGDVMELQSIITALGYLPLRTECDPEKLAERNREKEIAKLRLARLCEGSAAVRQALAATLAAFNGRVGEPHSFDLLDELLEAQAYRPAFWRVAAEEINYRRFFDINDLAAIRTEDPSVFQQTHELVFRLLCDGVVEGLRIDHIDGLSDPGHYLQDLQREYLVQRARRHLAKEGAVVPDDEALRVRVMRVVNAHVAALGGTDPRLVQPLFVVAEKILGDGEEIPDDWAVAGTTGYEFAAIANGLWVDASNEAAMDELYEVFTGCAEPFPELVLQGKIATMENAMVSEISVLSHQLERIAARNRRYRDFTLGSLTAVVREYIAALDVYRTYVTAPGQITDRDRRYVEEAIEKAKKRNPSMPDEVFAFLRDTLLLENLEDFRSEEQQKLIAWVRKFQQITGPVMAKGVEDTVFYVYNRLVSLNEVGGHPRRFGVAVDSFHAHNVAFARAHPHGLLTTSTHDTKRGEDVRARIDVLSEIPQEWSETVARWACWNEVHRASVAGAAAPDRNDEYLLYQTLVGALPFEAIAASPHEDGPVWENLRARVAGYMAKATKEAKVHTSWVRPDAAYDRAVQSFVQAVLTPQASREFLPDLQRFAERIAFFGMLNSLSQTVLKLSCPGVPDVYQGSELWDLSLVDPDNRRPVDYGLRRRLAHQLRATEPSSAFVRDLLGTGADGRVKMHVLLRVLGLRRAHVSLFQRGEYVPLEVVGPRCSHAVVFLRQLDGDVVLVAVSRLHVALCGGECHLAEAGSWGATKVLVTPALGDRRWCDVIAGRTITGSDGAIPLSDLLGELPVVVASLCDGSPTKSTS
jgi:(1->4)-alpha-D-glucan 1-alpha-D-glucosylmutase